MGERRNGTGYGRVVDDAIFRITRGPAYYQDNLVLIKNVVVKRFDTTGEAMDFADLINRALDM